MKKDFMKIRFESDDNLLLNEILKLHMLTVIVRSVFEEDAKFYSQVFLDECLFFFLFFCFKLGFTPCKAEQPP